MATIDLSRVQFWQPPLDPSSSKQCPALHNKSGEILRRNDHFKSIVAATQHQGRDYAFQQEARAQGHKDDKTDDDLPLLEEFWGQTSREGISTGRDKHSKDTLQYLGAPALDTSSYLESKQSRLDDDIGNSQGTRGMRPDSLLSHVKPSPNLYADRPVILENDGSDTPNPEATAEPSKPTKPPSHGLWWDVDDGCYINDDFRPIPLLEQEDLASMPDQSHSRYHSPGVSHGLINQHDNGKTMRSISDEPASYTLLPSLAENSGESNENAFELERSMQLAFEEEEKSLLAPAPSSYHPYPSTEPSHLQFGEENDQSGTGYSRLEGLRPGFPLRSQNQVGEAGGVEIQQHEEPVRQDKDQQNLVEVIDADGPQNKEATKALPTMQSEIPEINEHCYASRASRSPSPSALSGSASGGKLESRKQGEKRGRQGTHIEISNETHDSINDEDPRPAKRRKPRLTPAVTAPLHVRQSLPSALPPTTNLEIDYTQPQANRDYRSISVDNEIHYTPRSSRGSPARAEPAPVAEYQEWPFQGFLKRTKIGADIIYNLEFQLPCTLDRCCLPIATHALDNGSNQEMSAAARTPHSAVSHSEVEPATLQAKRKRVLWTSEENKIVLKMKKEGCQWDEIHAALPHRSPGAIQVQYSTKLK
ncbi:hypothetical protein LAWI1_G003141 [Lachnellula willkommii]|uniref:Myb-like domain-containing protein n=1 Tax=Lachnellula willkommii TaxID=215461 RepID=A0A559MM17_9HELO|nr:hypothetical protein LAWI1_G003141 [Lachnellula willkommii]